MAAPDNVPESAGRATEPAGAGGTGTQELALGAEFPTPTREQWREQVEAALHKSGLIGDEPPAGPIEDVVATRGHDGLLTHPLYTADDAAPSAGVPGSPPFTRGSRAHTGHWDVRQLTDASTASDANADILADLAGPADSCWLRLGPGGSPVAELDRALDGVLLEIAGIVLDAGSEFGPAANAYLDLADRRGVSTTALSGSLGADPLSAQARTGAPADLDTAVELARRCAAGYPRLHALVADGLPYHDAGGSDADELGASIAAGVTYLRALTAAGMDVDTACGLIEFRYAATVDQFRTIAKLRAARRLWERVTRVCGASEAARAQHQHAVTSAAMLTRRDPWVNMLRATVAAFAAGTAGARAVTVRPFDAALGIPDAFGRRIARNTQALLLEESRLAQVTDPAGGSWYVERLTDELSHAAWEWFQSIESAGGLTTALDGGIVEQRVADMWRQRADAVAHRHDPITGVTEFPELSEELPRRAPAPAEPAGGLAQHRYAEAFERLRDAADEHLATTGQRPRAFLATLGPLAVHTARASFARNLLAAAGIEAVEAGPTETAEEVLDAFGDAGTSVALLCSADQVYAERAAETARALATAGARRILLAGKPASVPEQAREAVDEFAFAGCDALAVLTRILDTLGVRQ